MTEGKNETPRKRGRPRTTETRTVVATAAPETEVIEGESVGSEVIAIQLQANREIVKERRPDEEKRQRMLVMARWAAMGIDLVMGTALQ